MVITFCDIHVHIARHHPSKSVNARTIDIKEFCKSMRYLLECGMSTEQLDAMDALDVLTTANQLREESGQ